MVSQWRLKLSGIDGHNCLLYPRCWFFLSRLQSNATITCVVQFWTDDARIASDSNKMHVYISHKHIYSMRAANFKWATALAIIKSTPLHVVRFKCWSPYQRKTISACARVHYKCVTLSRNDSMEMVMILEVWWMLFCSACLHWLLLRL